jgi:uncharacterized protein (DUF1501 family)
MTAMFSRRDMARMLAGSAVATAFVQLGRSAAIATPVAGYKAMVGIFLFGGNDGWNMVVPNDARYAGYAASRGSTLALPQTSLATLSGSAFALHPAMAPALTPVWNAGALNLVLNAGTLFQPLTKAQYLASPTLRPTNLASHADEQAHWQGLRARDVNVDGFMGRLSDRVAATTIPGLISFAGSNLALLGKTSQPLILPSNGTLVQTGATANNADPAVFARRAAVAALADGNSAGAITASAAQGISSAYAMAVTANSILTSTTSVVDRYFVHPTTGAALTSDISRQLLRTARMIEARSTLGHARQTFFVSQGGYDNHSAQVSGDNTTGTQAALLGDLANAMAAFHNAMTALGLAENVTAFTMSDFGRTYKVNAQRGTDHAWGSNHLVVGGALAPRMVHGTYPSTVLGGADDISSEGRFLPTVSQEQYIGAIARWHGVADADLPYVFPNWATWSGSQLGLFG